MTVAIVWFRQDLRSSDNIAFASACNTHDLVIPLYIKDQQTQPLGGAQQWWLHHSLKSLEASLEKYGLDLILREGDALEHLKDIIQQHQVDTVYWNRCYEPRAIERDSVIKQTLKEQGILVKSSNASLLNEPWTIKNKSGEYFKVFTPYWKSCLAQTIIPEEPSIINRPSTPNVRSNTLEDWSLLPTSPNWAAEFSEHWQPGEVGAQIKLNDFLNHHLNGYKEQRNHPASAATSKLSPHLHFGEISPWQILRAIECVRLQKQCDYPSSEHFLAEIGWREFSYYLLYHYPQLPDKNFKSVFDSFPWHMDPDMLKHWQQGMTGYPIVDAGMRELWKTGTMHNRVRMIVASFLTKDLFIDWRIGASWFMDTLLDADLASNSASWQWVAGSGADAAPYFRIFNPVLQGETFDPAGEYVKRWVPELSVVAKKWVHKPWMAPTHELKITLGKDYPYPIVDHSQARQLALGYYQTLKK